VIRRGRWVQKGLQMADIVDLVGVDRLAVP
jgi:hypothetical protein